MIGDILIFLKNSLNAYMQIKVGWSAEESREDRVVFIDGERMDPLTFQLGAVSVLLINIEEENLLRPSDPYMRISQDGLREKVHPEIRLNLYVLFVARFKQYEEALRHLSIIIQYFQNHRVLNHQNAPELSESIDQLIIELVTLPFADQNEVWNALRTTYHPSVLYKVKMIVFSDENAEAMTQMGEKDLRISQ